MTIAGTRSPCDEATAAAQDGTIPCPPRDKPWVLATAILGSSLAFVEGSVVMLALPAIQADFQTTSTGLQWVMNAYLLMLGAFMLIGGSLGDRFGLRRIFMLGTAIFGAGALACAFAPSLSLLIGARIVQGFGGALLVPASLALVGSHFDEDERGRAIGMWAGASALTTAIGPVLGGWLVDQWGWRSVFLLVPPLAALTLAIAVWRVPKSPAAANERLDYTGAVLLAAALLSFIYALVDEGTARWLIVAVSIALGVLFVWRERTFTAPMLPLELFRSRAFSGANLLTLLLYCALNGVMFFLPFNLIQVQGWSAMAAGAALLPFTLILGFGSTFAGDLIRKVNPRVILTIGPLVTALGFGLFALPGENATFVTGFLPAITIMAIGMTLSVAPLTTVVMNSVDERRAGVASGVNNTVARLAGVLAVAVLTAVAVNTFASGLRDRLQGSGASPEVITQMTDNASRLAELEPPANAANPEALDRAVARSYVETFRVLMILCGVLAALGGLIAWFFLADGRSLLDDPASGKRRSHD